MRKILSALLLCVILLGAAVRPAGAEPWIVAHRGFHQSVQENTVAAFLAAAEAGFRWVEADLRPTSDGVMVLSHNNDVSLYKNGTLLQVRISLCPYENLKNFTWDEAGLYPVASFDEVLEAMKPLDVTVICDLKAGENDAVLRSILAADMESRAYLSLYSTANALKWVKTLNQHPTLGVRIRPTDYFELRRFLAAVPNPIIADVNATLVERGGEEQVLLSNALSAGLPIVISGCTMKNRAVWCGIAAGVMANEEQNITPDDFLKAFSWEKESVTVQSDTSKITVSVGSAVTCTFSGSVDAPAGYLYACPEDAAIASAAQSTFGSRITCTVTGLAPGTTTLRVFSPSGTELEIPVIVKAS